MNRHNVTILAGILALVICCAAGYFWLDRPLTDFFATYRDSGLYLTFKQVTRLGESQWYIIGGLLAWVALKKRAPKQAASGLLLFSSVAASGIAANLFKSLLGRARPRLYFNEGIYGFDFFHLEYAWLSFPSGHSATALGAASALALIFPRYRIPLYLAGIVVASSRIILTEHYLSDVIAGSALGIATTFILYRHSFQQRMHEPAT